MRINRWVGVAATWPRSWGAPTEPRTQAFLHRIIEAGRL
jgi:hypothetical protein